MSILASGGGHGTQSIEVRARLLDGPCGSGDHPGDQAVVVRGEIRRASRQRQLRRGTSSTSRNTGRCFEDRAGRRRKPTPSYLASGASRQMPAATILLCAQDTLQPKLYMMQPAVDQAT